MDPRKGACFPERVMEGRWEELMAELLNQPTPHLSLSLTIERAGSHRRHQAEG